MEPTWTSFGQLHRVSAQKAAQRQTSNTTRDDEMVVYRLLTPRFCI